MQLLMFATLECYRLQWPLGEDNILLVSMGTGFQEIAMQPGEVMDMAAGVLALRGLLSLMDDASALNEVMLQWMSRGPSARVVDREIGDLRNDLLGATALLTYARYDALLETTWLKANLNLTYGRDAVEGVRAMDDPSNIDVFVDIGKALADDVKEEDFPATFNL